MRDKFRANLSLALPAALIVTAMYIYMGRGVSYVPDAAAISFVRTIPYILVIVLALAGMNVVTLLTVGIIVNGILGWCLGSYGWVGWMASIGGGINSMGELIIVSLLAGGVLEMIRYNGGIDYVIGGLTRRIHGRRGAELAIAGLVSLVNLCTANNTIAIITTGPIAKDISARFGISPQRSASLLDTFSCLIQGIIPYGAQMLMASGLAGISAISIIGYLYSPFALGLIALASILFARRR